MRQRFVLRVRVLLIAFAVIAALFLVRLYFVQVVHGAAYREEATSQYIETSADIQDRGLIFWSGAQTAAASMEAGYRIAIRPGDVEDAQATYDALTAIVPLDAKRFFASAAKTDDPYEEIATQVKEVDGDEIKELDLPGVLLVRDRWRFYPAEERAAHVLGFVGYQGNERVGVYGLERYWEDTLAREAGTLYVNFFAEIFSNVRSLVADNGARRDGDLVMTIDESAQRQLEGVLADIEAGYSPKQLGGIVMDPKTGAVVAMAVRPTFDPNTYYAADSESVFANPLVESVYELGSIFKPLTVAAGLDTGAVTAGTTYNDTGCIERSGFRVCNYDFQARGVVDMQEVLNQSLNTGAAFVAEKTGHQRFENYFRAFGLAEETDIDLPNEAAPQIAGLESGAAVDYASASFGQGIAVTPVAMTRALAVLANGGVLVRPHVVSEVRYRNGLDHETWTGEIARVLKPETAEEITRMLVKVYDDALLGGDLKKDHYSIAAKTGTAQIANPAGGGYYTDRYLHSFFGYFPAYNPEFLVFLFAVEPQGVQYASQTLARPFDEIATYLINQYDIPPDR